MKRRYRPKAAAEYLGNISESNLAHHRMKKTGPAYLKIGRLIVYEETDLDAWADSLRRTCTRDLETEAA